MTVEVAGIAISAPIDETTRDGSVVLASGADERVIPVSV